MFHPELKKKAQNNFHQESNRELQPKLSVSSDKAVDTEMTGEESVTDWASVIKQIMV